MKILAWNIRQGGGPRRDRINACIAAHDPDIVAIVEFIPGSLSRSLHDLGFEHVACTARRGSDYALCVASRMPINIVPSAIPVLHESGVWLEINVPDLNCGFGVLHAPTSPRTRMREFLSAIVAVASVKRNESFLFVGDFNTGIGPIDGPMNNFGDVDRFRALQTNGFTDAWRHFHGERIEPTYTFPRSGKSYRIDHALASDSMLLRIQGCHYSHEERHTGISDHSPILIEISRPSTPVNPCKPELIR